MLKTVDDESWTLQATSASLKDVPTFTETDGNTKKIIIDP